MVGPTGLNCHLVQGHGSRSGPNLTYVTDKLSKDDTVIRIVNGGVNMPAYGATLKSAEISDIPSPGHLRASPAKNRADVATGSAGL